MSHEVDHSRLQTRTSGPWWRSGTIYQIYPHSFADGNGDGLGDLAGILAHVDHLEWLGVDAVWLSPVYPSPQHDNGYDVSDYRDIEPRFGTLGDLDQLISALHERGIRLIMDLVVNHTSSEHEWFEQACSSRDSPYRDWYIWRDPRPGTIGGEPGAEPTNWGSYFSEPAWTWHEPTQQYYLHLYARQQPDLNWQNPAVRDAVYDLMGWWLDRGVDGFRMDVINLISKPDELIDGEVLPGNRYADPSPFVRFGPRLTQHLTEMHERVFAHRPDDIVRIGETPGLTVEQARALTRDRECGLDMVFQFEHMELDRAPGDRLSPVRLSIPALHDNLQRWQTELHGQGWNSLYGNNHDQARVVSRFGDPSPEHWADSAKAVALALYLLQGTASMFQGEEIGMVGATIRSADDVRDIRSVNYLRAAAEAGLDENEVLAALRVTARDNARTPVQWSTAADAGFGSPDPWMPVAEHPPAITVEAQLDDPTSVLHFYRDLIALRHTEPVIADGATRMLDTGPTPIMAYLRESATETLVVVANLSSTGQAVPTLLAPHLAAAAAPLLQSGPHCGSDHLAPWQAFAARVPQRSSTS
jgi:oligo-1,6-glucosidase